MQLGRIGTWRLRAVVGAMAIGVASTASQAVVIYVDDDAPPGGDGLTWDTAFAYLQDALTFANNWQNDVTEVRVAQGIYKPDRSDANPNGTGNINASFGIGNYEFLGGFAGIGSVDPDARDVDAFETILSGDLAGDDLPNFVNYEDNSQLLVGALGFDGFTLTSAHTAVRSTLIEVSHCRFTLNESCMSHLFFGDYLYAASCVFDGNKMAMSFGKAYGGAEDCQFVNHAAVAVYASDSGVAFTHCSFTNNAAAASFYENPDADFTDCEFVGHTGVQGALRFMFSSGTFTNCVFRNNTAQRGGAIYSDGDDEYPSVLTLNNCEFLNNSATHLGGAIYARQSIARLTDSAFNNNSAQSGGALLNARNGSCEALNCTFDDNTANAGGAVFNINKIVFKATGCIFRNNHAVSRGGAVCNESSLPNNARTTSFFTNCVLVQNVAGDFGGAIYCMRDTLKVLNCTIINNDALFGGGVYCLDIVPIRVYNSIIRGNLGGSFGGTGPRTVRYCNLHGGHPGAGNIDAAPRFRDWARGDLRLTSGSPCVDAGSNVYLPASITTDIDGLPRFVDDPATPNTGQGSPFIVDIGAYELQQP